MLTFLRWLYRTTNVIGFLLLIVGLYLALVHFIGQIGVDPHALEKSLLSVIPAVCGVIASIKSTDMLVYLRQPNVKSTAS